MEPARPADILPRLHLTERRAFAVLAVGLAALAAGVALIVVSRTGGSAGTGRVTVPGAAETGALLDGIPRTGVVLGDPGAPVTLVEWADLQCPYCREWLTAAFPRSFATTSAREGSRSCSAGSPSSDRTGRGAEDSACGWAPQPPLGRGRSPLPKPGPRELRLGNRRVLLRSIAASVDGLDPARTIDESGSTQVQGAIDQVVRAGDAAHVTRTPTFDLGKTGSRAFERLNPATLTAGAFGPHSTASWPGSRGPAGVRPAGAQPCRSGSSGHDGAPSPAMSGAATSGARHR